MKNLSNELKKMDAYTGIEYAQRITELYKKFPNDKRQIDEYIENRVYFVAESADEAIAKYDKYRLEESEVFFTPP